MFFTDKGTRDLLPLIELHLDEITGAPPEFDGDHRASSRCSRSRQTPLTCHRQRTRRRSNWERIRTEW